MSPEEWVPFATALELPGKMVLRMSVLTHPEVTASFGQASYSVAEGDDVTVTVTLSADPERTVTIPITTSNRAGASNTDYSVPENVTFNSGETSKAFTFTATQDTGDDDDESVQLGFGNLPTGVSEGATRETVVSITDDDVPSVTVSFGQSAYSVAEGSTVTVRVTLSADPERSVTIPITTMNEGGASPSRGEALTCAERTGRPRRLLGRARERGVRVGRDGEDVRVPRHAGHRGRRRRRRERAAGLREPAHRRIRGRHQGDGGLDHRRRRALRR